MRSLFLVAAASLALATPVLAQQAPQQGQAGRHETCTQQRPCNRTDARPQAAQDNRNAQRSSNQHGQSQHGQSQHGPRVGERAQNGHNVPEAKLRRLPAPPKGQSYRVVDDQVVRVDSSTLKIMAVVGLLSALN